MALKKKIVSKPRTKRGILLTLLTLVIFILMLGEVITYVVLNINYDNLSASVAQSLASGNFAQNLDSGMNAFLYSSLSKSIGIMTAFESDPTTRMGNFITNSSQALDALLYNGTIFNSTAYYNNSFKKAVSEFEAEALADGFTANLSNVTLRIKQASPFRIGAYATGLAALNTSSGISLDYPINANTTVSLNSKPSLIGIEQGLNGTFQKEALPEAAIVGNLTAESGSESPYMFAYGKIIYMAGEPSCSNVPSEYANGNYILATPNAAYIGQNVCGMAGLITNISNSSTPLKPYLVYKNDTIMNYLQSEPNFLINGAELDLLNTSAIQSSAVGGFYYASPYTASYLQRVDGKPYATSPEGIFSFRSVDRNAANFTLDTQNISLPSLAKVASSSSATMSAWIYIRSMPNHQIILSDDWNSPNVLQMYVHTDGRLEADFGSGSAWINAANTSAGTIKTGKWYFVSATWTSGNGEEIYINGVQMPISYIVGNSLSTGTLGTPGTGGIANNQGNGGYFDGYIANEQIYNKSLSGYQIEGQYKQGINDMPVYGPGLVAWYPLSSNANDYSGNGYNGVPTNVIYTGINGYTLNPTRQQSKNYVSKVANFNGTNSYADVPLGWSSGTGISVVAWVYLNSIPANNAGIVSAVSSSDYGTISIFPNGNCYMQVGVTNTTGSWQALDGSECLVPYKWYQIIAVANQTNNTYSLYINGAKQFTTAFKGTLEPATSFNIGLFSYQGAYFPGSIKNVQIYKSVIQYSSVKALYLEGVNGGPLNNSNLAGWWPLDGNANDYSGNGNNGTAYYLNYTPLELPASTSPLEGVFGCYAMSSCNATAQRLYLSGLPLENAGLGYMNASTSLGMQDGLVPAATSFNGNGYEYAPIGSYFGTDNSITAEAWVYATPNTNGPIFGVTSGGAASGGWNMPFLSENGLTVHGWIWGVNTNNEPLNYTLPRQGWYNLIIAYNATSSSESFYVDGANVGSGTGTYSPSGGFDYWTTYITGAKPANVNNQFSGTMADVQLYKAALSPSQAEQLYLNNSVEGISPADYWPLSSGNLNLLNETENIANYTGYAYLYNSPSVACSNSQVINGDCGVEYVPG